MARVIRDVMTEYGATGPGFSINDPEVDHMSRAYAAARSAYFVIEDDGGAVIGGAGVAPLAGADPATCELRKMYLLPAARGRGLGRQLLALCLDTARRSDFRECYLETLASMSEAARLYERAGFRRIDSPRGATGHCGCDRWYVLPL